jgi:hypothetical protein
VLSGGLGPDHGDEFPGHDGHRQVILQPEMRSAGNDERRFTRQSRLDLGGCLPAARGQPLRQNRGWRRHLNHHKPRKCLFRQCDLFSRQVHDHHPPGSNLVMKADGYAVIQAMRVPVQGEVAALPGFFEFGRCHGVMRFAARFGRPGDHAGHEPEALIVGKCNPGRINQRVLASAGWPDNSNDTSLNGRRGNGHGRQKTRA